MTTPRTIPCHAGARCTLWGVGEPDAPANTRRSPPSRGAGVRVSTGPQGVQLGAAALRLLCSGLALAFAVGGAALAWVGVGSAALPSLTAAVVALAASLMAGRYP